MSGEMWVVVISVLMMAVRFCSMPSRFREKEETKIVRQEAEIVSEFVKDMAVEEKELLMGDNEKPN